MPLSKSAQAGLTFLQGWAPTLPEAFRAEVSALLTKITSTPEAEIEPSLRYVGDGAMARPDYSRAMNDLAEKTKELDAIAQEHTQWYAENKDALTEYVRIKPEYDKLKGNGHPNPNPNPNPTPNLDAKGLTSDQLAEELERRDRSYASVLAFGVSLAQRHFAMFNEALDMGELVADPRIGQAVKGQPGRVFGLQDAYNAKYGERVQQKAQEAETARINKLVEERLVEERKKQPLQQPYPLARSEPSALDALATKDGPAAHTIDTAVAEYERLQQARLSASP
jgi:hypothetical protein